MNLENYIYYNTKEISIKDDFVKNLEEKLLIEKKKRDFTQIVILCVGTDRVLGDSLGPLVGSKLIDLFEKYNIFNISIYGTLDENVNYLNVSKIINKINQNHTNACVVVVDAALSKKGNVGKIFVQNSRTYLGKSMNKEKIEIGNISIKAVVAKDFKLAKYNFKSLQSTSLGLVMKLSETVANGIFEVIKYS